MAFTFFFRDAEVLETAIRHSLPSLRGQAFIHIWDAGCAHGPEPYTLAILLREQMSEFVFRNVRIHATDVDVTFERVVRDGVFREEEVKRIPANLRDRYFAAHGAHGDLRVIGDLRNRIDFARHDLLSLEPVREGLALVVCKNVLLHFNSQQRCNVLRMFHRAMRTDGLLVMEHTQKLPDELRHGFAQVVSNAQIFRKLDVPIVSRTPSARVNTSRVDAACTVYPHTHTSQSFISKK